MPGLMPWRSLQEQQNGVSSPRPQATGPHYSFKPCRQPPDQPPTHNPQITGQCATREAKIPLSVTLITKECAGK